MKRQMSGLSGIINVLRERVSEAFVANLMVGHPFSIFDPAEASKYLFPAFFLLFSVKFMLQTQSSLIGSFDVFHLQLLHLDPGETVELQSAEGSSSCSSLLLCVALSQFEQ